MNTSVLFAVFKRNFVAYFANPTAYVFICLFVLFSGGAAFWPNEFFNANLANLDQLSTWFPWIMLVYIPAITMSIWAQERQQGTDELLLTIPAGDFDVVLGKYLAAVAIFSVSLLFSLVCNGAVLAWLGRPDPGLLFSAYLGYWLIGLAMLAIGMMASFLTGNLTIAFILGVVFNAPLVFLVYTDAIVTSAITLQIKRWSLGEQLHEFSRGVLSLGGVVYFVMIIVAMLYLCMVLIARRHWHSGRQAPAMVLHYLTRALALGVIAVAVTILCQQSGARVDATAERINSLSPFTRELLSKLSAERPVQIEAFISPSVPESYVKTRRDLVAMLGELRARGGQKVQVRTSDTEQFSEEASRAERLYGITPREVFTINRGAQSMENVFMGVAMTCGLQKVVIPFIDRGIPVEYELVRSLCTVTEQKRKKVGILRTDAPLYGGFNMRARSASQNWPIIDELEKQYEVVQVDPTQPITQKFDALLAVQPSAMGPEEVKHFIQAVEGGQPTAIFEDPLPRFEPNLPGTSQPRPAPGGMEMMGMMGQRNPPKGDIDKLWQLLGVDFAVDKIVWQGYNPYPRITQFSDDKEFVFLDTASRAQFNPDDPITSGLQHLLFPFPGFLNGLNASPLKFEPLVKTRELSTDDRWAVGSIKLHDIMEMSFFGTRMNRNRPYYPEKKSFVLAARITGRTRPVEPLDDDSADAKDDKKDNEVKKPKEAKIDVVLVADVDMLSPGFFYVREQGDRPEFGINFDFDNVTFVLNTIDALAGDDRFLELRKRRPAHRTLTAIDERTKEAKEDTAKALEEYRKDYEQSVKKEQEAFDKKIEDIKARGKSKDADSLAMAQEVGLAMNEGNRRLEAQRERLGQDRDRKIKQSETELALEVRRVQNQYKMWAVLPELLPPLAVGVIVFFTRRAREREGIARSRLR